MKKILLPLLASTLLLVGCAQMFQPKVDMVSGSGNLSDLLAEKAAITSLAAPSQLMVSKGDSSSYINLSWSPVTGAVSYRLERAVVEADVSGNFTEPSEELFEELEKAVYGTSYQDVSPSDLNARYYYRVAAENSREKLEPSPYSSVEYGTLFGVPQQTQADLGLSTDSVTVRWKAVDDAKGYEIYRSSNPDGSGSVLLSSVTADRLKYTDTIIKDDQGKEFYYTIYATNRLGIKSNPSSVAMGFALVEGAPNQPQNVEVTDGRGTTKDSITISWEGVTSSGTDLTYYVYRSSSVDSALALVAKITDGSVSYTDKRSLKTGIYYYYQVQASAIDEFGKELKSPFSDSGQNDFEGKPNPKAAEGFILSPPDEVFAEKKVGQEKITLKWLPALGNDDEKANYQYKIYAGSSSTGPFPELLDEVGPNLSLGSDGYISVEVPSHSFYTVVTKNPSKGVESVYSVVAAPTPFAATNISASRAKNLGAQAVANSSGVYPVQVTWSKPDDPDLAGFHIYRSNSQDSGYRKITDEPLSLSQLTYFDGNETARTGKKYWYKVLTVNSLGQGSHYSEPMQGWGALTHEQYLIEFNKTVVSAQKRLSLMHKPGNTDKLGSESVSGIISGSLSYNAAIDGLGARIIMRYENLADFYIDGDKANGVYFTLTGNSNTSANMSSNGDMDGTVTCTGMYPGSVSYDNIQIKGGVAGGGTYGVTPEGFSKVEVPYNKI